MTEADQLTPLKIYGQRNTGTNYLTQLLGRNLAVELLGRHAPSGRAERVAEAVRTVERRLHLRGRLPVRPDEAVRDLWFRRMFARTLGWKHWLVRYDALDRVELAHRTAFVTLTKNPYSWLLSMFDHPYHISRGVPSAPFEAMITSPWPHVWREGGPRVYESLIHMWNLKNRSYLALDRRFNAVHVSYERLIADPESTVAEIKAASRALSTDSYFTNITTPAKRGAARSFAENRDYYLNEEWRSRLSPEAVRLINASVDRDLMGHFGYQLIEA